MRRLMTTPTLSSMRCEHLVLGILGGGDSATVDVIAEQVDPVQLRTAIVRLLDPAA